YSQMYERLRSFKEKFPNTVFYNGHTGSKFTADEGAMEKLFYAMDELGLIFVDSRTTADTKAPEVAKKLNKKLLERDVFLDHEIEKTYIRNQLNLVVDIAKKKGYAIAIGHPHKETLSVLKEAVPYLKNEVEVIYLKDLYYAQNRTN
ncbi:MAG: divergent polysaccharide deacetylase family protein, partial [Campylobacteraceae bacterium]